MRDGTGFYPAPDMNGLLRQYAREVFFPRWQPGEQLADFFKVCPGIDIVCKVWIVQDEFFFLLRSVDDITDENVDADRTCINPLDALIIRGARFFFSGR